MAFDDDEDGNHSRAAAKLAAVDQDGTPVWAAARKASSMATRQHMLQGGR